MRAPMIAVGVLAAVSLLYLAISARQVDVKGGAVEAALSALGTLLVIALFVERAQQVYVGAWRGIRRAKLDQRIERWQKWQTGAARFPDADGLQLAVAKGLNDAKLDLAIFRQRTRKYVFFLGLSLGVLIAAAGPRILREVVEPVVLNGFQGFVFAFSDILITAGLIGGGSEAIHKIMAVITDSLDQTRKKVTSGAA